MSDNRSVRLFVGGHAGTIQGELDNLNGDRMFTAAHRANKAAFDLSALTGLLDSGAFTDPPHKRLTPDRALDRQLTWEGKASEAWGGTFQAAGLVSYDLLIDETWVAGERHKRRWSVRDADSAVGVTVAAAAYLASQRARLAPRTLILSAQGVDAMQYADCAATVLSYARPGDWFGLGGWCILGRQRSLLPTFWQTLYLVLPMVARAGLSHVHIFGVMWLPALGGLLYLADKHGLTVSTDSTRPVMACTHKRNPDAMKHAILHRHWHTNAVLWREKLANLRAMPVYKAPPIVAPARQLTLLEVA